MCSAAFTVLFQMPHKKLKMMMMEVINWEADVMAAFLLHILYGSILRIPSTTIDILVSALWPINLFTLPCQKITVYSWEIARMVRTGTVAFSTASLKSKNNREGIRQTDGTIWRFSLWRIRGKEGKQRRHDTRCFLRLPVTPAEKLVHTHTHTHKCKHQSFWKKTWTKVWSAGPCCVARK